jgi:hypothetical protein
MLLAALSFTAVACGNGGTGDGQGGGDQGSGNTGSGAGSTTNGSTGSGNTGSTAATSTGSGPMGMSWTGTWTVDLSYSESCDFGLGNVKMASQTQTDTLQIDASGSGLTVSFPSAVNYGMSGTGNDHQMTLTGQYPAKDDGGGAADIGQDTNTITIKIDTIKDVNDASGTISGQFSGEFGQKCTISSGTASFSR